MPIYIERIGVLKLQQLFKCTSEDRLLKYYAQKFERFINEISPACSKVAGIKIEQMIVILDLKGGQTKIMTKQLYDLISRIVKMAQDNFPETLAKYIYYMSLSYHNSKF